MNIYEEFKDKLLYKGIHFAPEILVFLINNFNASIKHIDIIKCLKNDYNMDNNDAANLVIRASKLYNDFIQGTVTGRLSEPQPEINTGKRISDYNSDLVKDMETLAEHEEEKNGVSKITIGEGKHHNKIGFTKVDNKMEPYNINNISLCSERLTNALHHKLNNYPSLQEKWDWNDIAVRCWNNYQVNDKNKKIKELEDKLEEYNDCAAILLKERELTLETAIWLSRLKYRTSL